MRCDSGGVCASKGIATDAPIKVATSPCSNRRTLIIGHTILFALLYACHFISGKHVNS